MFLTKKLQNVLTFLLRARAVIICSTFKSLSVHLSNKYFIILFSENSEQNKRISDLSYSFFLFSNTLNFSICWMNIFITYFSNTVQLKRITPYFMSSFKVMSINSNELLHICQTSNSCFQTLLIMSKGMLYKCMTDTVCDLTELVLYKDINHLFKTPYDWCCSVKMMKSSWSIYVL